MPTWPAITLIASVPQYNNYIMNQIDRDGPTWMPGGAGGGGEWKAIVGIKEGGSQHPLYVEFGTGIYAGGGLIYPADQEGCWRSRSAVRSRAASSFATGSAVSAASTTSSVPGVSLNAVARARVWQEICTNSSSKESEMPPHQPRRGL